MAIKSWELEDISLDGQYIFRVRPDIRAPYFEHSYSEGKKIVVERGRLVDPNANVKLLSVLLNYDDPEELDTDSHLSKIHSLGLTSIRRVDIDDIRRKTWTHETYSRRGRLLRGWVDDHAMMETRMSDSPSFRLYWHSDDEKTALNHAYKVLMFDRTPIETIIEDMIRLKII